MYFKVLLKMEENNEYLSHLREIRRMMEKSSKFLSLSGLSGILVGIYALAAALMVWFQLCSSDQTEKGLKIRLIVIALVLLLVSLGTALMLTLRRTRQAGQKAWGPGSKQMVFNLSIPLVTGGIFCFLLMAHGFNELIAPSLLIFYGLALVSAARFTHREIFYMGLIQILLGLLAGAFTTIGLLFWATGFGIVHIVYGTAMYFRYERNQKTTAV